jgi:hypothetical protein
MTDKPGGLVSALIEAQRNFKVAIADSDNPFFKSKYVDLAGAWDACREALWGAGLTVVQFPRVDAVGGLVLVTRLEHTSGEFREGAYPLLPTKSNDPQSLGAAMTYARRYCLMAITGLAPEDDDGNKASGKTAPATATKPATAQPAAEKTWMKRLQAAVQKLELGKADADERGLKGKDREDLVRTKRLEYLAWCSGRVVASTTELTDAEASVVIRRAEQGEIQGEA